MSTKKRNFQIIISAFVMFSITCNLPMLGKNIESEMELEAQPQPDQEGVQTLIAIEETYSEEVEQQLEAFQTDESVVELLDLLANQGYNRYTKSAVVSFDTGLVMHSLEVTNGNEKVLLAQFHSPSGDVEEMLFAFPQEGTMEVWDENGGFRLVIDSHGNGELIELDAERNPVEEENTTLTPSSNLLASRMVPQQASLCLMTGVGELKKCMGGQLAVLGAVTTCGAGIAAAYAAIVGTGGIALVLVEAFGAAGCGMLAKCMSEAVEDNPPTAIVKKIIEITTNPYKRCLSADQEMASSASVITSALYTVEVGCEDDRPDFGLVNPANKIVKNVSPGHPFIDICKDCAGQLGSGIFIHPNHEISTEVCPYGCVNVGEADARCLSEEEAAEEENGTEDDEEELSSGNLSPDSCVAVSESFSWMTAKLKEETGSRGVLCEGEFKATNLSGNDLVFCIFKETSTGSGGQTYMGFGPGCRILAAGETFSDTINHTYYDDKDETYKLYTKMLVVKKEQGCSWLSDTEMLEKGEYDYLFITIPDPCAS